MVPAPWQHVNLCQFGPGIRIFRVKREGALQAANRICPVAHLEAGQAHPVIALSKLRVFTQRAAIIQSRLLELALCEQFVAVVEKLLPSYFWIATAGSQADQCGDQQVKAEA